MAHPFHHALRSVKLFGGKSQDYQAIHRLVLMNRRPTSDLRHLALRHHSEGIFLCERIFGVTLRNSDAREVPVRLVGEQHVKDDLGWIPTVKDWLENLKIQPWMGRTPLSGRLGMALRRRDVGRWRHCGAEIEAGKEYGGLSHGDERFNQRLTQP